MKTMARRLGFFGLALCPLLPLALGGACATAITVSSGGAGGDGSPPDAGNPDSFSGSCTVAADCAPMNDACNAGVCVNGTCIKGPANEHGACDDGLFCTDNDACVSGVCVGGTPKSCAPPDSCHLGACDEATDTCVAMPGNDGAPCDDMDACTLSGSCLGGQCTKGSPVDCSVLDGACSVGTCVAGQGCVAMPVNDGTPCNDGLYCTINDHCQAAQCTGDPNPCAPPNNTCQVGVCSEALKSCTVTVAPNGTACDDSSNCTMGETCLNGNCQGGQAANNGAACDDKNGCTTGTTCSNGVCGNPQSQVNQCINADGCCPANCNFAQDSDCLYWAPGVLENVPPAMLAGWSSCYTDTYDVPLDAHINQVLQQCPKGRLLLACRPVGAANYQLAAMGMRPDVLFDCGSDPTCTHQANGVGWYFSPTYSWGFANAGDPVTRNECDTNAGPLRLCWHTVSSAGGYRCGNTLGLNSDPTWERTVMQAD